jgi:hypothetical protein
MLTSEFNPSANKIDVGDVDFNDNVVKKRVLTNEVNILENDVMATCLVIIPYLISFSLLTAFSVRRL